jgi:hypothetical protein
MRYIHTLIHTFIHPYIHPYRHPHILHSGRRRWSCTNWRCTCCSSRRGIACTGDCRQRAQCRWSTPLRESATTHIMYIRTGLVEGHSGVV